MLFEFSVHLFKLVFSHYIYFLLTFAFLCIIWYYEKVGRKAYYLRNFPGTPTEPFLGNLSGLMNGIYGIFGVKENVTSLILQGTLGYKKLFTKDKMYVYWQGWMPMINLFTPDAVEAILSSNVEIEKSLNYNYLHAWLGLGLLTSTGDRWRHKRKLLTPAFHFRILDDFIPIINEQSMDLVEHLSQTKGEIIDDIVPYVTRCTLDIISETAMGVKINAQNNPHSDYVKAINSVSQTFVYRNIHLKGWFDFIFYRTADGKKYLNMVKILHDFTRNVIRERKKEFVSTRNSDAKLNGDTDLGRKTRLAFLDLLVEQQLLSETSLTEEDIREEVDTFMFEGHDTTSMAISWSLYLIGLYPDIQRNIHSELDEIFAEDRSRHITNKELNRLKYLECCIKESLRLFPSVPVIARYVKNDFKLGKYTIPKGSTFLIWTYVLHRNELIFPQPEVFNPDRFLPENVAGMHPYAYVPFSAGPRNCIGQRFALSEEKIVIANILRNYTVVSLDHRDKMIPSVELVTRPKNPIRMRFLPRQT